MARNLLQSEQNCSQATVSHHPAHRNSRVEAHEASRGAPETAPTVGHPRHSGAGRRGQAPSSQSCSRPVGRRVDVLSLPDQNNNPHPSSTPNLSGGVITGCPPPFCIASCPESASPGS